mmetsp:Transcript_114450/g.202874  ORF Transcript_114450/g.202874 Transcript_114450/m.202874 type:complete len:211 (+) Transcript_114450:98-730(+)
MTTKLITVWLDSAICTAMKIKARAYTCITSTPKWLIASYCGTCPQIAGITCDTHITLTRTTCRAWRFATEFVRVAFWSQTSCIGRVPERRSTAKSLPTRHSLARSTTIKAFLEFNRRESGLYTSIPRVDRPAVILAFDTELNHAIYSWDALPMVDVRVCVVMFGKIALFHQFAIDPEIHLGSTPEILLTEIPLDCVVTDGSICRLQVDSN